MRTLLLLQLLFLLLVRLAEASTRHGAVNLFPSLAHNNAITLLSNPLHRLAQQIRWLFILWQRCTERIV